MTKLILLLCPLLLIKVGFSQDQKFTRILGIDFQSIPVRKDIPYMETAPGCEIIPSLTLKGDTSGLVYQNEFLLFRNYQHTNQSGSERSYLKTTFVSNVEYMEFQNWCRDSLARESIIRQSRYPELLKYIRLSSEELSRNKKDSHLHRNLDKLHENHSLNWKTKFSYQDPKLVPVLADMHLPQPERFYKKREYDERKIGYRYRIPLTGSPTLLDFYTILIDHPAFWASKSLSDNDEYAVLGQIYERALPEFPVIGLTGMQAHAFCHWKEAQLQQLLNEKQIPYLVRVRLPMMDELTEIPFSLAIPMKDYTSQWKIAVKDYQAFISAVRDSVLMETLYKELQSSPEEAARFIQYVSEYYDEGTMEYRKFDPKNFEENRYYFPLIKNRDILKKYSERIKRIETASPEKLDLYCYDRMDIVEKTIVGKLTVQYRNPNMDQYPEYLEIREIHPVTQEPLGMDLDLSYTNQLNQGTGVRDHENYKRFILKECCAITPGISIANQSPEDLLKGITYEQALAYYHWKYPIWKAKQGDDWQHFVYPNQEQFTRIQNGKQIVISEHQVSFPSPVFRYVVSFIPKNGQ